MTKLTRRDFLIGCTRLAAASVLTPWFKPLTAVPGMVQDFPSVSVAEGTDGDTPAQILQTALDGLGGIKRFVKSGQTVAIKPNATWAYPPHTASSTDPDLLTAVIQAVQDAGAGRIIVMDHCSIEPGAGESLRISGIGKVAKSMGVESIFPDRYNAPKSTYTKIDLPKGQVNQKIGVIKAATEADVRINLAVAKTHNVTKFTMCLKHMMGFLQQPGLLHANLEQGIADLSTPSVIQAQLHILEAIRVRVPYGNYRVCAGPETDISDPNIVSRRNTVIAGSDPVLIDSYGCIHLFGIQPQELTHLLRAYENGCGDMDVDSALVDGRIRRFTVGVSIQDQSSTASEAVVVTPQAPDAKPTAINIPDSELVEQPDVSSLPVDSGHSSANQVIPPSPLLKTVLVPVAAIITGISLAILNRMRGQLPKGQGTSVSDDDHDQD